MTRIAHVITGLSIGGAEGMLQKLLTHMDRRRFEPQVFTLLSPAGPLAERIRAQGIPVRELGMSRRFPNPVRVLQLARWLRRERPDLVQTWMYHADLAGGLASRLAGGLPLLWNIRNSTLSATGSSARTHRVVRLCARLSADLPDAVICCSHQACAVHLAAGYVPRKFAIIPNGFDLAEFRPDPEARAALRHALGVPPRAPLVGAVGRFDPQKDYRTFLAAAARLHAVRPDVRFVLCGRGLTWTNPELAAWIHSSGLGGVTHLLGERNDVAHVHAALDVATSSSSYGEAFPNVIGEAMACGVPCVVTDIGDSGLIVGDTGRVVPPGERDALAAGWLELLALTDAQRTAIGRRARQRIAERFSIQSTARAYEEMYERVLASRAGQGRASARRVPLTQARGA